MAFLPYSNNQNPQGGVGVKFSIKVVSLFIVFIFIAYALSYLDNDERIAPTSSTRGTSKRPLMKNEGYPLPVTGYESYIGQLLQPTQRSTGSRIALEEPMMTVNGGYSGQMLRTISRLVSRRMSSAPVYFGKQNRNGYVHNRYDPG